MEVKNHFKAEIFPFVKIYFCETKAVRNLNFRRKLADAKKKAKTTIFLMAENQPAESVKESPLRKLLNDTKVATFAAPKGGVVIVQSTETPYEGFQVFI